MYCISCQSPNNDFAVYYFYNFLRCYYPTYIIHVRSQLLAEVHSASIQNRRLGVGKYPGHQWLANW